MNWRSEDFQQREHLRDVLRVERDNEVDPPSRTNFDRASKLCLCRAKLITIQRDIRNIDHKNLLNEGKNLRLCCSTYVSNFYAYIVPKLIRT